MIYAVPHFLMYRECVCVCVHWIFSAFVLTVAMGWTSVSRRGFRSLPVRNCQEDVQDISLLYIFLPKYIETNQNRQYLIIFQCYNTSHWRKTEIRRSIRDIGIKKRYCNNDRIAKGPYTLSSEIGFAICDKKESKNFQEVPRPIFFFFSFVFLEDFMGTLMWRNDCKLFMCGCV